MSATDSTAAIEAVYRVEFPRVVAVLAAFTGDIGLAEELGGAAAVEVGFDHVGVEVEGAFGAGEGLGVVAQLAVHAGEVGPAEFVAGVELQGLGEAVDAVPGFLEGFKEDGAEVVPGAGLGGVEFEDAAVGGLGLEEAAHDAEGDALIKEGLGVGGGFGVPMLGEGEEFLPGTAFTQRPGV